jgi:hypothetical protein
MSAPHGRRARPGRHAGGTWDAAAGRARFAALPDKESPLWDVHSPVIYWWTATVAGPDRARRVCSNGHAMRLPKKARYGYLGVSRSERPAAPAGRLTNRTHALDGKTSRDCSSRSICRSRERTNSTLGH